jgi:uncharacterized Zn-binding protein involved in type VI secretion
MGTPVLHRGATLVCQHAGPAVPTGAASRITIQGQPVLTIANDCVITGCGSNPQSGGRCVSGRFMAGATRVLAEGAPVALQNSPSICQPTNLPMTVTTVQSRVVAL